MTTTEPETVDAPTVDPAAAAILQELAETRETIDAADRVRDAAQAKRLALWRKGLALPTPLTKVALASASDLSAEYITKALRPKAGEALAKAKRRRTA